MTIPEIFLVIWVLLVIAYLGESIWKLWRRSERYPFLVHEILTAAMFLLVAMHREWGRYDKIAKTVIVICVAVGIVVRGIGRKRFAVQS